MVQRFFLALGAFAIVASMLLAVAWPGTGTVSACEMVGPKTGDLNGDAITNSVDALLVLFYEAGLTDAPSDTWRIFADVNCDSAVNATDASLILQADAGLIELRA